MDAWPAGSAAILGSGHAMRKALAEGRTHSPGRVRLPIGQGRSAARATAPFLCVMVGVLASTFLTPLSAAQQPPDVELFFQAASYDKEEAEAALAQIAEGWNDGYATMVIDIVRFLQTAPRRPRGDDLFDGPTGAINAPSAPPSGPGRRSPTDMARARLTRFLERQTREGFGDNFFGWRDWMWNRPYEPHPDYVFFKAMLYRLVDERMPEFFRSGGQTLIRLDEVEWGGVRVNGIPPLDHPEHVPASEASYLGNDNIVFGIALHGDVRAYPKRILARHELARDRVGGIELAIVYCTLCGTVIPYEAEVGGEHRTFGTSGLLYRSNKLMFDEESMSLWSTVEGRPVIGRLAGQDLELQFRPVVTTTWKEWRTLHPDTVVLSLDTGYERDYSEGAAYRDYFRTDRLMFGVPKRDKRLKNKDEVLTLLLRPKGEGSDAERKTLALSAKFLKKNRIHHVSFAGHDLVVVTSKEGANRVYDTSQRRFVRQTKDGLLQDNEGSLWQVTEDALLIEDISLMPLARVPARRAFWFGWYAQFPETELIR